MNLTQNAKLNQVTADTLIVGVDIGSTLHYARCFDWRGVELTKRVFKFSNDHLGFMTFVQWLNEMLERTGDNSPEKSDLKDPKTIAGLVKDGRYSTAYIPEGVYAEIREASVCRDQIIKQHVRLANQIQGWLQKYFPEYLECYENYDSTSGLMLLQHAPLPQDIIKLGAGGINEIWRNAKLRGAGLRSWLKQLVTA